MWRLLCMNGTIVFKRLMICVLRNVFEKGIPIQKMNSPVISMYKAAVKFIYKTICYCKLSVITNYPILLL